LAFFHKDIITSFTTVKRKPTTVGEEEIKNIPQAATFLDKYMLGPGADTESLDMIGSQ
jgi:hypothetical protein